MNAYPAELIQHHYACMLVSGLLPSQAQIASPESTKAALPQVDGKEHLPEAVSPPTAAASTSGTSTGSPKSSQGTASKAPTPAQAFPQVTKDLCDIFGSRGRSSAWDPSKLQSAVFHTVLVDNNVRLPPKKTRPTPRTLNATAAEQQPSLASLQPRSPLSPLHPSSPLFPDGLIAPVWLRKHRELVPSVFVSFYCLTEQIIESDSTTTEEQKGVQSNGKIAEVLSGAELKQRDEALIRAISDRKRTLSERGIKFTVVLLTTRAMLESPALESRLSYIRRSSQLDSRASLFVLTPVSRGELGEFVTSLQSALYDAAQDYYREHYRRARKKRARYPPPASTVSQIVSAAAEIRGSPIKDIPLSKEGWLARNDYKLGTFAELTSNLSEALGHYLSAYHTLANELLASTMLLPPRTKRWAEAKVLSDCLNLKICKLYLYRNDGDNAWDQFKTHIKRFTELSQGWGIGEMTFEFWSWLGKQYRLMADLLDLATREIPGSPLPAFQVPIHFPPMPTFLLHPSHLPTPTANGHFPPSHNPQHGSLAAPTETALNAHIVPADMCQGAGACYYIAGICAMERWQRFRRMVWEEAQDEANQVNGNWSSLTQEKKVDHAAQAIEVFTKAHEIFKRNSMQRQSLLVASKIAYAYVEGEQYDLALPFLKRIFKTFQAEGWPAQAMSLLLLSLYCSQQVKDAESEGRALWSLLGLSSDLPANQRTEALNALKTWQGTKGEETSERMTIESKATDGVLLVESVFARTQIDLDGQGSLFQLVLSCPVSRALSGILFDTLLIYFSGHSVPVSVQHEESKVTQGSSLTQLSRIMLGSAEDKSEANKADLRWWDEGAVRAFQAVVVPDEVGELCVERICLLGNGATHFSLEFQLTRESNQLACAVQPRWMVGADPPRFVKLHHRSNQDGVLVRRRPHRVVVALTHEQDAYLEESFPFVVSVTNNDDVALQCFLEVAVHGGVQDSACDRVWISKEMTAQAGSRLDETNVGIVEPGGVLVQTVFVSCQQHLLTRNIDVLVKTSNLGDESETQRSELLETIILPVKALFGASFHAAWRMVKDSTSLARPLSNSQKPSITVSDMDDAASSEGGSEIMLGEGEGQGWSSIASINVGLAVLSREDVCIDSVRLCLHAASKHLRTLAADTCEETHPVSGTWAGGDRWGTVFDVEVLSEVSTGFAIEGDDGSLRPTGQLNVSWRRDGNQSEAAQKVVNTSLLDVPLLLPPQLLSRIVISIPSSTTLEQPLVMLLSIVNPSKLSSEIFVTVDDAQSDFGVLSHKTFTVPLIAKSTRSVPVHILSKNTAKGLPATLPIRHLPRVRAWQRDRRVKKEGEEASTAAAATTTAIMNHQRGGGIPLEVVLRYSKSSGPPAASHQPGNHNQHHGNAIAQLQAETLKSGAWTIFVHSHAHDVGQ